MHPTQNLALAAQSGTPPSSSPLSSELPAHVDREIGAALICQLYFPISKRTLERWPLAWRRVNGRAVTPTAALLAEARRRFEAAPVICGGHRGASPTGAV